MHAKWQAMLVTGTAELAPPRTMLSIQHHSCCSNTMHHHVAGTCLQPARMTQCSQQTYAGCMQHVGVHNKHHVAKTILHIHNKHRYKKRAGKAATPAINPTSTWDSNFMHLCIPRQPASWPALASNLQGYRAFADQTSAAATVIATVEQQSRGQQAHRHITHCC